MLRIRKIKPVGCQVLVKKDIYGWDDYNAAGIVPDGHFKGDLKDYQEVLAVGDDVKFVKPGDFVKINYYKYAKLKHNSDSLQAIDENTIITFSLKEVDMEDENGEFYPAFLIDQRDIDYILEDFDEAVYKKNDKLVNIEKPSHKLILPSNSIKV